jgi:ribonucleoside-diphosphate reductase alpha chain
MTRSTPYYWLNDDSRLFLERDYLEKGQTPEARITQISKTAEKILKIEGFAKKFEEYMSLGWYSLSTPIWSNFGLKRGLPISCFGSYIPDDTAKILDKLSECGMMSKMGGGTSAFFGDVRPRGTPISTGGKTDGPVRFMQMFESATNVISQGGVRRGSIAAYMPVEHPDIMEFLQIRDDGNPIQNMSIGVTITDAWMKDLVAGKPENRKIWSKIVEKRFSSGYPYISFIDNINNGAPQVYKDKGRKIVAQNLCNEIALSSTEKESFVCNLSSMNILHWDAWKNTDAVETLTFFLDAVMTEFISKASKIPHFECAVRFAENQRALGIGTLGWHSYLQSKMIPFESMEAKLENIKIHKAIYKKSQKASADLATMFGEPEMLKGYGLRNVTTTAIAPTTSSSFILGQVSPSIEPLNSNYFVKDLAKGKFTYRNPYLQKILLGYGKDTADVWSSVLVRGGSVQHLEFLTQNEKDVFKTFGEISQKEIVIQAGARQKWVDQGQSINIMVPLNVSPKEVSQLMIFAHESGVKGLYYQRGANPAQELARSILTCASCEA